MKNKCISIGGQALIEGVMMRSPHRTALAVRNTKGEIIVEDFPEKHIKDKHKWLGLPVVRGVVNFVESMITGYKALMRSMDLSGMTEVEQEGKEPEKLGSTAMAAITVLSVVLGVGIAVLLFLWLPSFLFDLLRKLVVIDITPIKTVFEGIIKILLFLGYVIAISGMEDIKRLFQYHGAEHKTIFCYENGLELTVENVQKMSRFHPRCGTSFLLIMVALSIIVNGILIAVFPALADIRWLWVLIKLLMIPVVCALGYELLKICGKYDNLFTKIVSSPGVWMQHITTKEPEDDMIEVAIASVKAVIPGEQDAE